MAYVALYRKYRSQSFEEVVGQRHIITVLQNAIRLGRIAHAYLFCGPRGCGKTSTARLLARALNCQASDKPTPTPCGVCDMCMRIRDGSAMDVIEMDAASETGIDDVREKIIENARYYPAEARFKVYIIDEVHDLSAKAFDSLLKTIEEPPAHVVFILATTEAHKVPITIRSRCQRMDFRRGTLSDLVENLKRVLNKEGVEYDEEAVISVARAAEGSFRDSLSLLEQTLAYSDGCLTAETVNVSIGAIGPKVLDEIIQVVQSNDIGNALKMADDLMNSGKDAKQTLNALQNHLRDLLVASTSPDASALSDVSEERFLELKRQSSFFEPRQLLAMLDILSEIERDLRFSNQQRLLVERALLKIQPANLQFSQKAIAKATITTEAVKPSFQRREPEPPLKTKATIAPQPAHEHHAETVSVPKAEKNTHASLSLESVQFVWRRVLKEMLDKFPSMGAILSDEVYVSGVDGDVVTLSFPSQFAVDKINRIVSKDPGKPMGKDYIAKEMSEQLGGVALKLVCVMNKQLPPVAPTPEFDEPSPAQEIPSPSDEEDDSDDLEDNSNFHEADEPEIADDPDGEEETQMEQQSDLDVVLDIFNGRIIP